MLVGFCFTIDLRRPWSTDSNLEATCLWDIVYSGNGFSVRFSQPQKYCTFDPSRTWWNFSLCGSIRIPEHVGGMADLGDRGGDDYHRRRLQQEII